jgi:hypothetical protein
MATSNVPATRSGQAVQGRVIPPKQKQQSTINVTYNVNSGQTTGQPTSNKTFDYRNNWIARTMAARPTQTPLPEGVPRFLGNAQIVGYAGIGAMILIGFDEWHNNQILPRPHRLWSTLIVYGLLALSTTIPPLIPLANAFAIGYLIMLLWQYFNGSGQFSSVSGSTGGGVAEGSGGAL